MESKHTPGPWRVANNSRSVLAGTVKINQQAGPAAQCAAVEAKNEFTLRANARLIAAAPDLMEACKQYLDAMDRYGHPDKTDRLMRAAIEKATGEK